MHKLGLVALLMIAGVGCGGGAGSRTLGTAKAPSGAQQQAATEINSSLTSIQNSGSDPNQGPGLAVSLYGTGTTATAENVKQGLGERTKKDFTDPTCVVKNGDTTTYNNCKETGNNPATVTGSVTVMGEFATGLTVAYNKLTIVGGGTDGTYVLDGSVTQSPTMITGTLTINLDASSGGAGFKSTVKVDYDATITASCGVSGGTVRIDYDTKVSTVGGIGLGGAGSTGGSAEFDYSACGQFMVRNS